MALIEENDAQSALTQLRAYLAQQQLPVNSRLPTERELCQALGVTRTAVRKALASATSARAPSSAPGRSRT
jgi:DNA-binding FadR family transcriptional regulator